VTAAAVKSAQSVTLIASANGVSENDVMQLLGSTSPPPTSQYQVDLSWNPPTSGASVAGYNVYRSAGNPSSFQLLNSYIDTQTGYSDSTVASGETYDYEVKSVSSTGQESSPSNITTVTIP
jgi:fibronectin type 3 domain-containing protein